MRPSTPEATHTAPGCDGQRPRRVADLDPLHDLVRARVDLHHVARLAVGDPQRATAERERGRRAADRDRDGLVALAVDPRDGPVGRVGDPRPTRRRR